MYIITLYTLCVLLIVLIMMCMYVHNYVIEFAKRGLHTSDFAILKKHNFICN